MFFPIIIYTLFYLVLIAIAIFFIFTWVNRYFTLKREQNDLLREIVQKMDKKTIS